MNTKGFFKKEDCMNNSVYMDEPVDQWFFSENDMMLFAKRYHNMKLSERQQPSEAKNNPDTKQLIIGDVSKQRELLKAFQNYYHSNHFDDERTFNWNIDSFLKAFNCC